MASTQGSPEAHGIWNKRPRYTSSPKQTNSDGGYADGGYNIYIVANLSVVNCIMHYQFYEVKCFFVFLTVFQ